jgi:excisionase family DNA binding protein
MDYITTMQAAEKWGVSMRQVQNLLKQKRIKGAVRFGRDWMIPADAEKPGDTRKNNRKWTRAELEAKHGVHYKGNAAKKKEGGE